MTMRGNVVEYEVLRPPSLGDALAMMRDAAGDGRPLSPLAGGTDLLVLANFNQLKDRRFVDLWDIDDLRYVYRDGKGEGAVLRVARAGDDEHDKKAGEQPECWQHGGNP